MRALTEAELIDLIEEGQRLRGWIANGYAQVEYLLGDMIQRTLDIPEYQIAHERLPHNVNNRIAKVREILGIDGPYSEFNDELEAVIERFSMHHEARNLLAHGFCTAHHTPDGDFGLEFRKWHREDGQDKQLRRTFRIVDLEYERAQLVHVSELAVMVMARLHAKLGLVGQ